MTRPAHWARMMTLTLALLPSAAGCAGKSSHEASAGHAEAATPAPAPPTPDTTPIEALRTPAGIALELGQVTAGPAAEPTPAPTAPRPER